MKNKHFRLSLFFRFCAGLLVVSIPFVSNNAMAQLAAQRNNQNPNTNTPIDTAKTNTEEWESPEADIYYTKAFSQVKLRVDSSIHTLHRRPYSQPWFRDLGNVGSPTMNLQFTPQNPVGLSLGYHSFDAMRFKIDSLNYYNTTRPYSSFLYNLGSKLEQTAQIFHTQNIKPYWNFAFNYRKINSPGFYFIQRNNHDNFYLTTNYASPSQQYQIYAAIAFNKQQHDENGGIISDTFLNNVQYADRKTVPVRFESSTMNANRSTVSNLQRDFTALVDHAYTWGKRDTTYNDDSTQFSAKLLPRFRLSHRMELGAQRYQYKDIRPDSLRYNDFFKHSFATADSVYTRQEWLYVDNRFLVNGLLGKTNKQILFNAGLGNRFDQFSTLYISGRQEDDVVSNYIIGSLRKEAQQAKQWDFSANAKLFVTGAASGNFLLDATIGKDLGQQWGFVKIGASQQLNNAPYNFTIYQNQYWSRIQSFEKESTTQFFASIYNAKYKLSAGVRNYVMSNYLYFDATQRPAQLATAFSQMQIWLRKIFYFGHFVLDNELIYQEKSASAPLNIPRVMGRHQFSIESKIFNRQLRIAAGVELRYHSDYFANGYSPFFNQFYYQNTYRVSNSPDASVFFNFNIKRFRAYIMFDQVQQFFNKNLIITDGYTAQNAMLRLGFNWVLIN